MTPTDPIEFELNTLRDGHSRAASKPMSFELFMCSFHEGRTAQLPRNAIRQAFGVWLSEESATLWRIDYDGTKWCEIHVSPDRETLPGAMVSRPVSDSRLWDALFEIMKLGNVVLFWPDCSAPLIANELVAAHLPPEMVDSLGTPFCIYSAAEIPARIHSPSRGRSFIADE